MQENKLPKDLTHLAEVISKSCGRWCHDEILPCFRAVLICIYVWQPCLAVKRIYIFWCVTWLNGSVSVFSCSVCEVSRGTGSFDWDPQDVFVRGRGVGAEGGRYADIPLFICSKNTKSEWATQQCAPPPLLLNVGSKVWKCWHTELRAAPETPRIPLRSRRAGGWGGGLECTLRSQSLIY